LERLKKDGYLSGIMLTNAIIGIQNTGRYAYIKHLAVNNGQHNHLLELPFGKA